MKLVLLVDNNTYIDNYYIGEPGISYYLEDGDKKILFDTGYSDAFITNAKSLNIDLSKINYLVLSHGHNDHTGGLRYLKNHDLNNVKLVCHPEVFLQRNNEGLQIGSPVQLKELKIKEFIDGTSGYQISDNLYFLGQIPRTTSFENRPVGFLDNGNDDYLYDDSALVYKSDKGLFVITACSHSGICNIIEYAKVKFNDNRIIGVIGGFHLLKNDDQLEKTVEYFKENNINNLYPCHCVSLFGKAQMMKVAKVHEVGVGLTLDI